MTDSAQFSKPREAHGTSVNVASDGINSANYMVDLESQSNVNPMTAGTDDKVSRRLPGEQQYAAAMEEGSSKYLEISEPVTLLSVMCRHPRVRWFAYFCGASTPELSLSMTWYQAAAFIWSWIVRLLFVLTLLLNLVSAIDPSIIHSVKNTDTLVRNLLLFQLIVVMPVLLYDICVKKRSYTRFFAEETKQFLDCSQMLSFASWFLSIYFVVSVAIFSYNINCVDCILFWEDAFTMFPAVLVEVFIFTSICYELLYLETVFTREVGTGETSSVLTATKYKALHKFMDSKINSHLFSFSFFVFFSLFACAQLLVGMYYAAVGQHMYPLRDEILGTLLFPGKDVFLMFLVIWRIASFNEKSRDLTLRIADNKPTEDNTYIYMQQNSKPIVYKIFGLLPIYRTEMILGFLGYTASLIAAIVTPIIKRKLLS